MDFISVIIPAFNAERWLEKTLRSVCDAIDADCEVIIVNDGSTDDTHIIGRRYADQDPRFTLIDIEHSGPCAARKMGFLESQGEYIMFVDSDDFLPPDSIREQRNLLKTGDIISGNKDQSKHTDDKPQIIIANTVARSGPDDFLLISGNTRALTGKQYATEILTRTLPGFMPGHLYARELLEAIDWDDSPEITHHENFYLLFSMAMKMEELNPGKRLVLVVPSVIGYYYIRRGGSQSALMALTPKGLMRVWHHINKLNLPEPELTFWGLELLKKVFIERGIPFRNDYPLAEDLRQRAEKFKDSLPEKYKETVEALHSKKKRTAIARKMASTAGLTSIQPHLSVIIICRHNVSKVARTVESIFAMGFRNLEVVIVDMESTAAERFTLNSLAIRYARVRVVKHNNSKDMYEAATLGLQTAQGLCVTYIRPGDLVCAEGLYDAVTRIDYGADVVLPNYREYNPLTKHRGPTISFADLRGNVVYRNAEYTAADVTEDVYGNLTEIMNDPENEKKNSFFVQGIVWRTDFIKDINPQYSDFAQINAPTISQAFLRFILNRKMRVVTQDKKTGPSFEFAHRNFVEKIINKFTGNSTPDPFTPTNYR